MRWQRLFEDLEAQLADLERAELDGEVRDRTRRELALLRTADRVRAARGAVLQVSVLPADPPVRGLLLDVGPDWLLLEEQPGRDALVSLAAVQSVSGLGRRTAAPEQDVVAGRLDLRWALRGLVRDRAAVRLQRRDGRQLSGTLDRVGADHVDLAEHPPGEARRALAVTGVVLVPLEAVSVVRSG